ncbi:MAG: efflux RND transporter periplasmic adaptor subunit [Pseudomonadales bacterium]
MRYPPLALICVCLALAGCGGNDRESAQGGRGGFGRAPTQVVLEPASVRPIREYVEAIGTAGANESVTVTAKVTDKVNRITFEDGDYVDEGEVLVELTNEEETALLAEAQANVDDARRQYQRLEDLLAQRSVPVSQVDEARARLAGARARYQSVLARLDDRLVRAPFSGLLGFREVSAGTLITPGTPITTLDDISVIKLDFSIPEIYLTLLEPGMRVDAHSAAYPDRVFPAEVRTIGTRVDPVTRAAVVRAHIDNRELLLKPGMLMTVRLTTAERNALMVPEDALVQRSNQVFVYTVEDGHASMQLVEHATRYEGWVEITRGLEAGEPVIVEGVIKVRDGAPVAPVGATAGPGGKGPAMPGAASEPDSDAATEPASAGTPAATSGQPARRVDNQPA